MPKATIGVYNVDQLFQPEGIRRYLTELKQQDSLFGNRFIFAPVVLKDAILVVRIDLQVEVTTSEASQSLDDAVDSVQDRLRRSMLTVRPQATFVGVLVASPTDDGQRVFQSTWYEQAGFERLLRVAGFTSESFSIALNGEGKGFTATIRPLQGAVPTDALLTCLNNVIGCVFIDDQVRELHKIAQILQGLEPRHVLSPAKLREEGWEGGI